MAYPSYNLSVRMFGSPTNFTGEAMTAITGTNDYRITDGSKATWRTSLVEPAFFDNGVPIPTNQISNIDYLFGKVLFTSNKAGPITVDGQYTPMLVIGEAHEFSLTMKRNLYDDTAFLDTAFHRIYGLFDIEGNISMYGDLSEDIDPTTGTRIIQDVLLNGTTVVVSIRITSSTSVSLYKLLAMIGNFETKAGVDDLVDSNFDFFMNPGVHSISGRSVSFGWEESTVRELGQ